MFYPKPFTFYNRFGITKEDVKEVIAFYEKNGYDWTMIVAWYMEMLVTGPDPKDTPGQIFR